MHVMLPQKLHCYMQKGGKMHVIRETARAVQPAPES